MASSESLIYIPPLGKRLTKLDPVWDSYDLDIIYEQIDWEDTDFDQRFEEIETKIKSLGRVSLLGASGSTSTCLNLFARRPENIHRLVSVCGKINRLFRIGDHIFEQYPNFKTSIDMLPDSLDKIDDEMRQRILCVKSLDDKVVLPEDAVLAGAQEHIVPGDNHMASIVYGLTTESKIIADFIIDV